MGKKKTAVEVYLSAVFRWGLIILVCACMCATVMFNTEKLFGLYPEVPWIATIGLAIMDIIYFTIAIIIVKTSFVYGSIQNFLGIFILFPDFNCFFLRY